MASSAGADASTRREDRASGPAGTGASGGTAALVWVGHLARIAFGLIYVLAAATKFPDPVMFTEQIVSYELTPAAWAPWQAPLFLALETMLGVALIVNFRPRITIPAGGALMFFFMVILAMAWAGGYTGSCGCFGSAVDRSPAESMVEDALFLGIGILAWFGMRAGNGFAHRGRAPWQAGLTAVALIIGLAGPRVGPELPLPSWATHGRAGNTFDHVVIEEYDGKIETGDHLIAILGPTEPASVAALEALNELVSALGVPEVVGVFEGTNEDMMSFVFEHMPYFEGMGHAPREGLRRFYRRKPVVLAVREGTILAAWHETVPDAGEVAETFKPGSE